MKHNWSEIDPHYHECKTCGIQKTTEFKDGRFTTTYHTEDKQVTLAPACVSNQLELQLFL